MSKPPYAVPSMSEIAALPWNGYNVVSTFSGAGGSCLGYRMAGYKVLWANEFIPAAQDTYKANHPDSILDKRDIRTVKGDDILQAIGLGVGEVDIFDGSPPCASFSTAGKREAGWGKVKAYSDTKQRTDDLFFEYARLLRELQPKVFVAENVSGLIKGTAKGYFKLILQELKDCGYNVTAKVLDAQWLGVPQMRQRLIFVGVRKDIGLQAAHPKPLDYQYSVRDALPNIDFFDMGREFGTVEKWNSSRSPYQTVGDGPSSGNGLATKVYTKGESRKFSIAELRRICAFPDDYILTGTYAQQWERMGRAVPPVMMMHIAKIIEQEILCKTK